MKIVQRCLNLTCWLLFTNACVSQEPSNPPLQQQTVTHGQAVLDGGTSEGDQDYTVFIRNKGSFGTGVLIAPNLVITAQHIISEASTDATGDELGCVPGKESIVDLYPLKPEEVRVFVGPNRAGLNAVPTSPTKSILSLKSIDLCKGDLGFIILQDDLIDVPYVPMRLDSPPAIQESVFTVGWGATNTTGVLIKQRQTRNDMNVLALGPGNYGPYVLSNSQIVVSWGSCQGDSGSGIFDNDSHALLGVLSALANPAVAAPAENPALSCGEGNFTFWTRLDLDTEVSGAGGNDTEDYHIRTKILEAFKTAGHAPWREGKPKPLSFASECSEDLDCDSMSCILGHCSSDCSEKPCPEGYVCSDQKQGKACVSPDWQAASTGTGGTGGAGQAGDSGASLKNQGDTCQGASECASNLCLTLSDGGVCSSACDTTACQNKWECTTLNDKKVCVPPSGGGSDDSTGCAVRTAEHESNMPALLGLGLLAGATLRRRRR